MRYKVPQNIDMQDRIIGPLTMVQFIYAVVGGGVCYAIYMSVPKPFSLVLVLPIALFVTALIFLKINERPFLDFVISLLEYNSLPRQRIWHHNPDAPDLKVEIYQPKQTSAQPLVQSKEYTKQEISEMAKRLDQGQSLTARK